MKEADAMTKWCPMARMVLAEHGEGNTFTVAPNIAAHNQVAPTGTGKTPVHGAKCIGSACMMWRTELQTHEPTGREVIEELPDGRRRFAPERVTVLHGYCGIAGKP